MNWQGLYLMMGVLLRIPDVRLLLTLMIVVIGPIILLLNHLDTKAMLSRLLVIGAIWAFLYAGMMILQIRLMDEFSIAAAAMITLIGLTMGLTIIICRIMLIFAEEPRKKLLHAAAVTVQTAATWALAWAMETQNHTVLKRVETQERADDLLKRIAQIRVAELRESEGGSPAASSPKVRRY